MTELLIFLTFLIVLLIFIMFFMILKIENINKLIPKDSTQIQSLITSSISESWSKLGVVEKVSAIEVYAKDIKESYSSLEKLLRTPTTRGSLGEIFLEKILKDQLPQDMYGIRKRILHGIEPDAYIYSTEGYICIDSKFPLDNYNKLIEAKSDSERENYKKEFIKNVENHLKKIAENYVAPENGTANFAFAYIPSESIYYFLINEASDLIREYAKKGVLVTSPNTLIINIELIKSGIYAKKLSEEAEKVKKDIISLEKLFKNLEDNWKIFYNSHLKNAYNKAQEIDESYKKIKTEFDRISKFSQDDKIE